VEYFLGQCDLANSKSNTSYKLVFDRVGFYTHMWISTFSSRSKSSPENQTKLSLFRFVPAVESWCPLTHVKIEKTKKGINNAILISHSTIPAMFMDSSSTKLPRNARGNIIRGNSIPSKNNLRGIRMGIGPIWRINSLTPLSSLALLHSPPRSRLKQ